MIPGPFSICHAPTEDILKQLRYGYDSAEDAYRDLNNVAAQENVPSDECCVIRYIDIEESAQFKE